MFPSRRAGDFNALAHPLASPRAEFFNFSVFLFVRRRQALHCGSAMVNTFLEASLAGARRSAQRGTSLIRTLRGEVT